MKRTKISDDLWVQIKNKDQPSKSIKITTKKVTRSQFDTDDVVHHEVLV